MYNFYFKLLPIAIIVAVLTGCGSLNQVTEPVIQGKGIAMLKIVAAAGSPFQKLAKTATLTISASDMLTMSKTLTITDSSVQGTITGIPAGKNRLFAVAVYDSLDTLQYSGSASANVIADSTVKVTISVVRIAGNAIVNGNIIDTTTGSVWQTKNNMPVALSSASTAVLNNFIYVLGGALTGGAYSSKVFKYDPQNDSWDTTLAPLPLANCYFGCAVVNNKIYIIGGANVSGGDSVVYEFDPALGTYVTKKAMKTIRYAFGCVAVADSIFTIDGCPGGHTNLEAFRPSTNSWSVETPDISGRGWLTAAFCLGKIYSIGGDPSIYATKTVNAYDLSTNSWANVDSIPIKSSVNCAQTVNNAIYVMGGNTDNLVMTDSICKYDPTTNKWKVMQSKMPVALGYYGSATVNNKIYIFGGMDKSSKIYNSVMVYDPSLDN